MIYVIDNGQWASAHTIFFVEFPDDAERTHVEAFVKLVGRSHWHDYKIVATAKGWDGPNLTMTHICTGEDDETPELRIAFRALPPTYQAYFEPYVQEFFRTALSDDAE